MTKTLVLAVLAVTLAACATPEDRAAKQELLAQENSLGRIMKIDAVMLEEKESSGAGAVAGAVVGGVIGHQVGGGTGQAVATVAGAVVGAKVGDSMEKKLAPQIPGQRITILLMNEQLTFVMQEVDPSLRVGDLVRIDKSGGRPRVVPR